MTRTRPRGSVLQAIAAVLAVALAIPDYTLIAVAAVVSSFPYEFTRIAWYVGRPVGITTSSTR